MGFARAVVVDSHLDSASRGICSLILLRQQLPAAGKMGRFNALLLLVFAFGLMISASMAKAPIAAAPKQSPTESPEAAPPASAPSQAPPATTPSQGAPTPGSLSTPSNPSDDHKGDRTNRSESAGSPAEAKQKGKYKGKPEVSKLETLTLNLKQMNLDWKPGDAGVKGGALNGIYNANTPYHNNNNGGGNNNNNGSGNNNNNNNNNGAFDKRFKTLPSTEMLPRNEILGGYIFVCNNDTMQEDLKRQLFGLPQRYRDSVRAITPGLPLFLYNYTTHQLHGVFEAASF